MEGDALSARGGARKACPGFDARNGMSFPDRTPSGKRVPFRGFRMGCAFPLEPSAETAFRNWPPKWDTLSAGHVIWKMHPSLSAYSGMRFPLGVTSGRHIPVWAFELGRIFRWRGCWESRSQIGEMQRGDMRLNSPYSSTSLSHVGNVVCLTPAVCSFFASTPAERTSLMVKRTSGWP